MEKINKIIGILVLIILFCMSIAFLFTYNYIEIYKIEIYKRDVIIENLNKIDSINQFIIKNPNHVKNNNNGLSSGEIVKYANEMSNEIDSLYKELDSLRYYKIYYDLNQSKFNHKFIAVKNASGGRNYSLVPNAISLNEYNKCQDTTYYLQKEIISVNNSLKMYKNACDKYDIKIKTTTNNKNGIAYISYDIISPKLDSALMLLPVYGDKLKFDSKKNEWSVGGKLFFRFEKIEKDTIIKPAP